MKFIDRASAVAVAVFLAGAFFGGVSVFLSMTMRTLTTALLQSRMLSPMRFASQLGEMAIFLLIFLNNSVPVVLSFLYPFAMGRIRWTPPLSRQRNFLFLGAYTLITAFITGFFSLGAPLATAWIIGGANLTLSLIQSVRVHGPLEFGFVLVCVAEPLRLVWVGAKEEAPRRLADDRKLLFASLVGILLSAVIEVFLRI
jgi:hypothetical protein